MEPQDAERPSEVEGAELALSFHAMAATARAEMTADEDEDDEDARAARRVQLAVEKEDEEKLRFLLARMDPNVLAEQVVDSKGNTVLHFAALRNSVGTFSILAKACPKLLPVVNFWGQRAIDVATEYGCMAIVLLVHSMERASMANCYRLRQYYACSNCGLCVNGRNRFASFICSKNRDHRWAGDQPEDIPRHVVFVQAEDFSQALTKIKKMGREAPRPQGWWCKQTKK